MAMKHYPSARRTRGGFRILFFSLCGAALLALGSGAARSAGAEQAKPGRSTPQVAANTVREVKNLSYWQGRDADAVRHRLDLYLPKGKKGFPVIMFVHGGAWMLGDKSFFGWGGDIGRHFARQGIGAVLPSYRLSPGVKHPGHVQDLARALAWVRKNIAGYGGDAEQLFLCGHSAGGHLVSLLATDARYLRAVGLKPAAVKGVIAVSGVYRLPEIRFRATPAPAAAAARAGGERGSANRPGPVGTTPSRTPTLFGFRFNPFSPVFGSDVKVLKKASPLTHVKAGLPPFLLIYADHDLPLLPGMAREFARALKKASCEVQTLQIKDRDHEDVMFRATTADDPVARAICQFAADHATEAVKKKLTARGPARTAD
jgi:acetyl esterase/lipase